MIHLDLFKLNIDFYINPRPANSPALWAVPDRLKTLSLYVNSDPALNLLASLIKASTPSLTHLTVHLSNITHSAVTDALQNLGHSITHLFCASEDVDFDGNEALVLPLLAVLPAVHTANVPISAVPRSEETDPLGHGRSFALLALFMHPEGYFVELDELVDFLERVKVTRLELPQDWWDAKTESAADDASDDSDDEGRDPVLKSPAEWLNILQGLVETVTVVEF